MSSPFRFAFALLLALNTMACSTRTTLGTRDDAGSADGGRFDASISDGSALVDGAAQSDADVGDATVVADAAATDAANDAGNVSDSSISVADMGGGRDAGGTVDAGPAACAPMDAMGAGDCDAVLGYSWVGTRCSAVSGCTCTGDDCGLLYRSREECTEAHRGCVIDCGGRTGNICAEGSYCNYPLSAMCGIADGTGLCDEIPEACIALFAPVCGCDGVTYGNSCYAASAGTSVYYDGECEATDGRD